MGGSTEKNLQHRRSRYNALKDKIDILYESSTELVDTGKINSSCKFRLNYIDLFAGAGGLSLGIEQAGFHKLCDVEILPFAVETLKRNFPNAQHYSGDITEFRVDDFIGDNPIHLVVGGPPCQGFSVAGRRNVADQRNVLFRQFQRVVKETNPYFFILENVPGILTLDKGSFYNHIIEGFEQLGYNVSVKILEAADYGVPQLRTRAIFIGNRIGIKNPYPAPQYKPKEYKSIESAIADLENAPRSHETNHEWTRFRDSMTERIHQVPPGGSLYETFADAYKRQRVGQPSMTIKENHGGTHIHYKLDRCLSAREMARLQTFPDDFIFEGTFKQAFVQVGNAVPPLLAKNIGLAVRSRLESYLGK